MSIYYKLLIYFHIRCLSYNFFTGISWLWTSQVSSWDRKFKKKWFWKNEPLAKYYQKEDLIKHQLITDEKYYFMKCESYNKILFEVSYLNFPSKYHKIRIY